jgi:hypothetical protein
MPRDPWPEVISGSIYIRKMGDKGLGLQPGEVVSGHKHNFDHTTILFTGQWHVRKWDEDEQLVFDDEVAGPHHLLIDKECLHEFTFLGGADLGQAWCVFSHHTPQGELSLVATGWPPAYDSRNR